MTALRTSFRHFFALVGTPLVASLALASCTSPPSPMTDPEIDLRDGWTLVSSSDVTAEPSAVATVGFDTSGWISTSVPSTVLAALTHAGVVEEPYFGRNLEEIATEQFQTPWWYRTELTLPEPLATSSRLIFEGINYSAEVWLNGKRIAGRDDLVGAFRMFDLDITDHLVAGSNALAVKVYPPQPGDPTIGFVDWNPSPPDRNMGLWRGVKLRRSGAVSLDQVFVETELDLDTLSQASLTITGTLKNRSEREVSATIRAVIGSDLELSHDVLLQPGEERLLTLSPESFEQLVIAEPRLWWPNGLGEPNLYDLKMTVDTGGQRSDVQRVTFGIRHVEDYLTEEGHRGYSVNGKKLLIRGGGWVDDLMLADDAQRIEDQIRYVKHMNLNTIRLEGFWGSSRKIFDLADRYGVLVMAGWSCQWEWEDYLGGPVDEFGGIDTPEEMDLVTLSLRDQVIWLRNHPSVFVWVLGSDMLPRPALETRYRQALDVVDPTRPALATCAVAVSEVSGASGVKMNGPYDWVPPNYWYLDKQRGGAYGFNTETGPGPQPPPIDSIRRMMPEEHWWPIDEMWNYHCGRNEFNTLDRYMKALDARYGKSDDLETFARRAQVANYEGMRAMFEAFSIRRPETTGVIQWMLNSAWPEMYWQLYDHYLVPNGAFYGARDGSRPINIAYDYADRRIVVVNETGSALEGLTAQIQFLDLQSRSLFAEVRTLDAAAGTVTEVMTTPRITTDGRAYFLDARLLDADGDPLAASLYWLSTEEDVSDWEASEWFYTPTTRFADLTGLASMPPVDVEVVHRFEERADGYAIHVTLANPSDKLAFFIELKITGAESGRRAAPVLWSDNYVSLVPGETREIHGEIPRHALAGEHPEFHFAGINVPGS